MLLAGAMQTSAQAQVEYLTITPCTDIYGPGWYLSPDGTVCINAGTAFTLPVIEEPDPIGFFTPLAERIAEMEESARLALQGVAITLAMPAAILPAEQRYAIGLNWGEFEGFHAIGFNGALAIGNTAALTAGAGMGITQRSFAFRGGLQLDF